MPSTSNPVNAVTDFLIKSQVQYLATIGLDDKPKVRPFQFMLEEGGRLYFCTSNQKPVFKEMQKHPYVEFCASGENFSWLRLNGKVVFSKDLGLKAESRRPVPSSSPSTRPRITRPSRSSTWTAPRRPSPISAAIHRKRSDSDSRQ